MLHGELIGQRHQNQSSTQTNINRIMRWLVAVHLFRTGEVHRCLNDVKL